jgi:SAM-dependent methyltransferase
MKVKSYPSPWVVMNSRYLIPNSRVLDLACGYGRHSKFLLEKGHRVTSVDRDGEALREVSKIESSKVLLADLEKDNWPFSVGSFDAIVVTNYLHRSQFDRLVETLSDQGVLIFETFMIGNEQFGRPSNPEFLLYPDELTKVFGGALRVIKFEQGYEISPKEAMVQRVCAMHPARFDRETIMISQ